MVLVVCLDSEGHLRLRVWLGSCPTTTPVPPWFICAINDATEHTAWIKHLFRFLFRFKIIKEKTPRNKEKNISNNIPTLCGWVGIWESNSICAYLMKDYSNTKLEGLYQGCLNNPPSPTSDSLAIQLAGTAEGFTCWEWVSSYAHIYYHPPQRCN